MESQKTCLIVLMAVFRDVFRGQGRSKRKKVKVKVNLPHRFTFFYFQKLKRFRSSIYFFCLENISENRHKGTNIKGGF